jgi:hypothetical protein
MRLNSSSLLGIFILLGSATLAAAQDAPPLPQLGEPGGPVKLDEKSSDKSDKTDKADKADKKDKDKDAEKKKSEEKDNSRSAEDELAAMGLGDTDSRIKQLEYNPGDVYTITTRYGYQTNIAFSPTEEIEAISKLARSTKPSSDKAMMDGVLSQPGDEILITSGPLSKLIDGEAAESVMLETQAIRAVQVPGTISRLHVVDSSVCQVVCNGNRLFIVADQPGQTIIEANMGKHQKPLHMKVVVERPWARGKSASVNLDQMQAIVSHLAPTAEITVQPSDEGSLIVTGFAQSNQQAKKVLEAIRKMVLVPVVDQVEVR